MVERSLDPVRLARVVAELSVGENDPQRSLCTASAGVVRVSGAGVVLVLHGRALGTVCVSDPMTEAVEDVQYTLGEGPCVDAFLTREPVQAPDLTDPAVARWPGFREGALAAGVQAVFGFPIMVGTVCIGALDLYDREPGPLTDEQYADAVVVAHVAGRTVMGWQSVAGSGSLAWQLEHVPAHRAVVHQATGMVSVQAAVPVQDAVMMLRAYAFAEDSPISIVSAEVVGGRLRFD
jgi:GAF domain